MGDEKKKDKAIPTKPKKDIIYLILGVIVVIGFVVYSAGMSNRIEKLENENGLQQQAIAAIAEDITALYGDTPYKINTNNNIIRLWYRVIGSENAQKLYEYYISTNLSTCQRYFTHFAIEDRIDPNGTVHYAYRMVIYGEEGVEILYDNSTVLCMSTEGHVVDCNKLCPKEEIKLI